MDTITERDIDLMNEAEQEHQEIEARKTPLERAITVLQVQRGILEAMTHSIDRFLAEEERIKNGKKL